jgi:hypothetical protein
MRLIIAGSRFEPSEIPARYAALKEAFAVLPCFTSLPITEIVSGGARGADKLGERLAAEYGIPCSVFNADWDGLGKRAGYIRNAQMAEYVAPEGILLALWDGVSKGTQHMIKIAEDLKLVVLVWRVECGPQPVPYVRLGL